MFSGKKNKSSTPLTILYLTLSTADKNHRKQFAAVEKMSCNLSDRARDETFKDNIKRNKKWTKSKQKPNILFFVIST